MHHTSAAPSRVCLSGASGRRRFGRRRVIAASVARGGGVGAERGAARARALLHGSACTHARSHARSLARTHAS
eukprot:1214083-Pleurochrysis_carterae.AAC.1